MRDIRDPSRTYAGHSKLTRGFGESRVAIKLDLDFSLILPISESPRWSSLSVNDKLDFPVLLKKVLITPPFEAPTEVLWSARCTFLFDKGVLSLVG